MSKKTEHVMPLIAIGFLLGAGLIAFIQADQFKKLEEFVADQSAQLDRINARSSTHTKTTDRLID